MTREIIEIVDENDNIIGSEELEKVHQTGVMHRESYVYLINSKKEVLLQRRIDNNRWDHSAAGHFLEGESYRECAKREFEEEIGVSINDNELERIGKERIKTINEKTNNKRFVEIFIIKKDITINDCDIDTSEVKEIKYFTKRELEELLRTEGFKDIGNSARIIIKKYILDLIS